MPPAPYDVIVVGLGLAGLVAALEAARSGARTLAVGRGHGGLSQRHGALDVLGYAGERPVRAPAAELPGFVAAHPEHPYALAGSGLEDGLGLVREAARGARLDLLGAPETNRLVATAVGTLRPSCLVPPTMDARWDGASVLAVGLPPFRDAWPELFAAALPAAGAANGLEVAVSTVRLELGALRRRRHLGAPELARCLDDPGLRDELAAALRPALEDATLVAFPAVLGLEDPGAAGALRERLGLPLVELPSLPPSVPGLRLERALLAALRRAGVAVLVGPRARVGLDGGRAAWVELESTGHASRLRAGRVLLATGGFRGGGLWAERDGRVTETAAGLPVAVSDRELVGRRFLDPAGQPMAAAGVRSDERMRPLDGSGRVVAADLYAAGGLLAGADRAREKSADGIACATAVVAAREAAR